MPKAAVTATTSTITVWNQQRQNGKPANLLFTGPNTNHISGITPPIANAP